VSDLLDEISNDHREMAAKDAAENPSAPEGYNEQVFGTSS